MTFFPRKKETFSESLLLLSSFQKTAKREISLYVCTFEVLFGDGKEELGLDHYQLMDVTAIVRFWTLALLATMTENYALRCQNVFFHAPKVSFSLEKLLHS